MTTTTELLDEKANNYVCAWPSRPDRAGDRLAGLAFLDVSTGRFQMTEVPFAADDPTPLFDETQPPSPPGTVLTAGGRGPPHRPVAANPGHPRRGSASPRGRISFRAEQRPATLTEHFRITNLAGYGCEDYTAAVGRAGGLLRYIAGDPEAPTLATSSGFPTSEHWRVS